VRSKTGGQFHVKLTRGLRVSTFLVPLSRYSALGAATRAGARPLRALRRELPGITRQTRRAVKTENHLPRTRFCNFLHFFAANYKKHPAKCRTVFEDVALIAGSLLA